MDWIEFVAGIVAGVIASALFEDPVRALWGRFSKRVKTYFYRPKLTVTQPDTFSLGKRRTSWVIIDGDGEMEYTPSTIICRVENKPVSLPPEIAQQYKKIEQRENDKREKGLSSQWNGPLYALSRYAISRTVPDEHLEVIFTFFPTDYFTFQATVMSLDVNLADPPAVVTMRQKHLEGQDIADPKPFLANGFGVALTVITKDNKILLSRRHHTTGARSGELDTSVVEGIHPVFDRLSNARGPDLYRTAIRGADEELGIDLMQEEITFLGFGVDAEYYQWNMIGVARTSDTAQVLLDHRNRGRSGKWEMKKIELIDSDPRTVFDYVKDEKIWSTGLVAIYWALVHEYTKKRVDKAMKEIFGV
jgi:hypothetical protein